MSEPARLRGCRFCCGVFTIGSEPRGGGLRCPHCLEPVLDDVDLGRPRQRTMAMCVAALLLYPAAILLPALEIQRLGVAHETSVIEGTISLWQDGHPWLSLVVLICSIVVPLTKILGLFCLASGIIRFSLPVGRRIWGSIDVLGRWGMLDVLLVAALVAVVKLGDLVRIEPGPGAALFALMVVCSLAASAVFDPRIIRREA